MGQLFTDKYFPVSFDEFVGNPSVILHIKKWSESWNKGETPKPLFFYGVPGIGKTCLALLTAKLNNWQLFEMNASDLRSKNAIEKLAGAAALNASFTGKPRLILLDEIDGLQSQDRGGQAAINAILKSAKNPIILTANNVYGKKNLTSFLHTCDAFKFDKPNYLSVAKRLAVICEQENIDFDQEVLKALAQQSESDVRASLHDLQTLSNVNNKITLQDVEESGFRERKIDVFKVMNTLFKSQDLKEIKRAKAYVEIDPDLLKQWIDENIPRIMDDADTMACFNVLSRADIFDGRILKRNHWGFLRYSTELATSGIAFTKEQDYHGWLKFQFPSLLKQLSSSKGKRALRKQLAEKTKKHMHGSKRDFLVNDFPYFQQIMQNKQDAVNFTALFEFNADEVALLLNTKSTTKKVHSIIEEATAMKKPVAPVPPFMKETQEEEPEDSLPAVSPEDVQKQTKLF